MTKRELINALEALPCSDGTKVAVYSKHQELFSCFVEEVTVENYDGTPIIDICVE